MPKRGSRQGRGDNRSSQNFSGRFRDEHDDRGRESTRRVSFKTNRERHSRVPKIKHSELSLRTQLQDEDIDMSGLNSNNNERRRPMGGPVMGTRNGRRGDRNENNHRGSPMPHRKLHHSPAGFYIVTIPYMEKYEKDFILKTIQSRLQPDSYNPLYFKKENNRATFYVDDFPIAEKILQLSRMITLPNGHKMVIHVNSGLPQYTINDVLREKMCLAMANRFNANAKALDLSRFHLDPTLSDIYCSLARPQIMIEVVNVIASRIPDLVALNLDNNKIHVMDHMKCIAEKLPNITVLHLKDNKIRYLNKLEPLKKLNLTELILDGNPLRTKYHDTSSYIRDVRKMFPKLVKLDGADFPPEISFDLAEAIALPPSNPSFLCNPAAGEIVKQFLQQYFAIYDSQSRQPLLDAYHENSAMSLSVNFPNDRSVVYNKFNRNMLRYRDNDSRLKALKMGKLKVVTCLSELPKTIHDPTSFEVDLSFCSPVLMVLSVTGIFKELNGEKNPPIRAFHRTFVIAPAQTGGFCIRNDELCIMNASPDQVKSAFEEQPVPVPHPSAASTSAAVPLPGQPMMPTAASTADGPTKEQLVEQMAFLSDMNVDFSTKCLIENNWNLQKSMGVFLELQKQNKIPPEAFIQ